MSSTDILLTIVGILRYKGRFPFSAGRQLICAKEPENSFDKLAIKVLDMGNTTVGYIANNSNTALEGTSLASDVYGILGDYFVIEVVCSTEYNVTCKVIERDFKVKKLIEAFTTDRFDPSYPFTEEYPPECPYPFDYCEFPFEYDLVNIDLTDETIPYKWRTYLIGCELGIDDKQVNAITDIADEVADKELFYMDAVEILYALESAEKRDAATIEKIIRDSLYDFERLEGVSWAEKDEIPKIALRICEVLNG